MVIHPGEGATALVAMRGFGPQGGPGCGDLGGYCWRWRAPGVQAEAVWPDRLRRLDGPDDGKPLQTGPVITRADCCRIDRVLRHFLCSLSSRTGGVATGALGPADALLRTVPTRSSWCPHVLTVVRVLFGGSFPRHLQEHDESPARWPNSIGVAEEFPAATRRSVDERLRSNGAGVGIPELRRWPPS